MDSFCYNETARAALEFTWYLLESALARFFLFFDVIQVNITKPNTGKDMIDRQCVRTQNNARAVRQVSVNVLMR
jgi:hypothetical protein